MKNYDVGLWFDKSFKGEKIPTLIDIIKFCNENQLNLNIEVKSDEKFANLISYKVQEVIKNFWSYNKNILISSFEPKVLEKISESEKLKKMILFYDFKINDYLKENLSQFSYIGLD